MTEIPSVREPGTHGNHVPIGQSQNDGSSDSQEIQVSMENLLPEGTEYKYITSPNVEALGRNVHVRRSERIRNSPQRYNPGFWAARDWNNDAVASIFYMIQDRNFYSNVDTDYILSLMTEWDAEDCMDTPSTFHMKEYYLILSRLKAMILILQRIWKHYQAKFGRIL